MTREKNAPGPSAPTGDAAHAETSDTRQMQQRLLGILKAIDRVCRDHGLTYYLLAGSCLGAVRHGGFIPWDDDADVGLPRPDYDLLVAHAREWLPEGYELVSGAADPRYPYPFARIQDAGTTYVMRRRFDFVGGLPVDVYPLDGMTGSRPGRRWHYLRYGLLKKLLYFTLIDPYKHGHGLHSLLVRTVRRFFDPARLHRRLAAVQREYPYASSPFVADHDYRPSKGVMPRSWFSAPLRLSFEDASLQTVSTPDAYLRHLYGDYMQPPQELPPRNYRLLLLDRPYREYVGTAAPDV